MMKASSIVTRNILQQKRVLNLSRRNLCAQIIPATIEVESQLTPTVHFFLYQFLLWAYVKS